MLNLRPLKMLARYQDLMFFVSSMSQLPLLLHLVWKEVKTKCKESCDENMDV